MKTGPLYLKLKECDKKIAVCQGGGDAGKTVTILQYLATELIENPGKVATVTAQDGPNLTGGAMRSFQRYVAADPEVGPYITQFHKQEKTYYFSNGSIIEFKSFDDEQDARGSERDYLFMNECNSRTYTLFWQLQRKTRRKVLLDYNPTAAFWVHNKVLPGDDQEKAFKDRVQLFIIDHRHNPFLPQEVHDAYESIGDPELFRVYARGKTGKLQGLVFGHFRKVTEPPAIYDRIIYGIDYGYTNDPTAIAKIWCWGRHRYAQELSYTPGISDEQIKAILLAAGWQQDQSIYSEADPNMINQLRLRGLPVIPAIKGPGSLAAGISKVKEFECFYLPGENLDMELKNYKWVMAKDLRTGKEVMTNQPIDADNHLCDAIRYAIYSDSFKHR